MRWKLATLLRWWQCGSGVNVWHTKQIRSKEGRRDRHSCFSYLLLTQQNNREYLLPFRYNYQSASSGHFFWCPWSIFIDHNHHDHHWLPWIPATTSKRSWSRKGMNMAIMAMIGLWLSRKRFTSHRPICLRIQNVNVYMPPVVQVTMVLDFYHGNNNVNVKDCRNVSRIVCLKFSYWKNSSLGLSPDIDTYHWSVGAICLTGRVLCVLLR